MPRSRSSTGTRLLIGANMLEVRDGAPPVRQALVLMRNSSSSLSRPLLSLVEHDLGGHQLGQARGRQEVVGVLLEQHRAAVGVDQDRVRRRGLITRSRGLGPAHRREQREQAASAGSHKGRQSSVAVGIRSSRGWSSTIAAIRPRSARPCPRLASRIYPKAMPRVPHGPMATTGGQYKPTAAHQSQRGRSVGGSPSGHEDRGDGGGWWRGNGLRRGVGEFGRDRWPACAAAAYVVPW